MNKSYAARHSSNVFSWKITLAQPYAEFTAQVGFHTSQDQVSYSAVALASRRKQAGMFRLHVYHRKVKPKTPREYLV